MKKVNNLLKNENGSATIEFLGIVPLALLLLVIVIQFVVGINGVLVTNSAASEYANVYSTTKSHSLAVEAANDILNATGDYLETVSIQNPNVAFINPYDLSPTKEFDARVNVRLHFIFMPDFIPVSPVNYSAEVSGRVIE